MRIFALMLLILIVNPVQAEWAEKLSYKGDVRLRTEGIKAELEDQRWRQRVRARLKLSAQVNEQIKATIRLATGASSGSRDGVASTNITNDSFGDNKPFNLDMAYVTWQINDQFKLEGGKLKTAFYKAGGSDILWDNDLTPEGGQMKYNYDAHSFSVFSSLAGYFLIEDNDGQEASVLGGQVGLKFGADIGYVIGAGYYQINMEGFDIDTFGASSSARGNTVVANKYLYNYNMVELFAAIEFDMGIPIGLYSNYVSNQDVDANNDALYLGLTLGHTKEIDDFRLRAGYRKIKKDAVLGMINDGDFNAGSTDGEGYTLQAQYKFMENSVVAINFLSSESGISVGADEKYERYMLDWAFNF